MDPDTLARILDVADARGYRVAKASDTEIILREQAPAPERKPTGPLNAKDDTDARLFRHERPQV